MSLDPIASRSSGSHFLGKASKPKPWALGLQRIKDGNQLTSPPETLLTQLSSECVSYIEAKPFPAREQKNLASAVKLSAMRSHAGSGFTRFIDDGRIENEYHMVERSMLPLAFNRKIPLRRFQRRDRTMANHSSLIDPQSPTEGLSSLQ
ncbi:hypothetical protein RGCCGE502_32676 (plasmid) [Rhizobium grahamii CCGE 502]|uniref:Uncharacterized protein n=1 Tax=Rhizobium grahamii CCGE 502 TaxID=990285 RepID=S3HJD0_9HYPH|nr:hypothetical protein RGCCGE502_32676 [Rhizobium grahamii CCGE 502]